MADCECISTCPFFNDRMANMPTIAAFFKTKFCRNEFASCARYQILKAKGREHVPADLFPNQAERVPAVLAG